MSTRLFACLLSGILACQAVAAVPDLTSSLTFVCDVSKARWGSGTAQARSVYDLQVYQDRIFAGTGDWGSNKGPVYAMAIDPESRTCTNECTLGTDACETIRVLDDGNLYYPATDIKDGHTAAGYFFRRNPAGLWHTHTSPLVDSSLSTHFWDFFSFEGSLFAAGYGIAASADGGTTWTDVNPAWKSKGERFCAFLKCGDELFARSERSIPFNYKTGVMTESKPTDLYQHPSIYHHWNKQTAMFDTITNLWANIHAGLHRSDFAITREPGGIDNKASLNGHLWHATPFKDRCLYVLGSANGVMTMTGNYYPVGTYPAAAFSAWAENGELRGTRVTLETGAYPYDFTVFSNAVYLLSFKYKPATSNMEHGVWKSTDGLNFSKLFTFDFQQVMSSLEYHKGFFYFGAAFLNAQPFAGTLKSGIADRSGYIYRAWFPQADEPVPPEQDPVTDVYPMYFTDASGYVTALEGDSIKSAYTNFMFTTNDVDGTSVSAGKWNEAALSPHAGAKYYCTKTIGTPNPSPAFATNTVVSFAGDLLVLGNYGQLYSISGTGTRAFPHVEKLYMLGGSRLYWSSKRNPLSGTAHIRRTTASLPARMQSSGTFTQSVNLDFEGEANQWFTVMSDSTNTVKTISPVLVMEGSWSNYYGAVTISNRTIVSGMTMTLRYQKGFVPAAFYVQTNGILQVTGEAVFSPRRLESWTSYSYEVEAGKTWTVGDLVLHEPTTFALKDATASVVVTNGFSNVSGSPLVVQLNQSTLAARAGDYDLLTLPPGSATGASAVRVDLTGAAPKGFACTTSVVTDPETGRLAYRLAVRRGCKIFIR